MVESDVERERQSFLDALLQSDARLKLIVAGPGTGKTYSFKRLLESRPKPRLVLTFINNLVEDLARELAGIADVRTLHSFARTLLHRCAPSGISHKVDYYPPLTQILAADATHLLGHHVSERDVERVFHTLDVSSEILEAALRCGEYYDAVGHTDSVYRLVRHFDGHPEHIPPYSQVVVDEYQDFSALEVRLIDQLSSVSPMLVVGDDDQALYGFKHASPRYLRDLAAGGAYERFDLPYCSRCTDVMVRAVHRVVESATACGLLQGRLDKPFDCYWPSKQRDSERYPTMIDARCSVQTDRAPYMSRYVEEQVRAIPPEDVEEARESGHPAVLVTGPVQFASRVYRYLDERFRHVEYKRSEPPQIHLLDGYARLLHDPSSRLGWRLVAQVDSPDRLRLIVRRAVDDGRELSALLPAAYRDSHLQRVDLVRRLQDGKALDEEEAHELEAALGASLPDVESRLGQGVGGNGPPSGASQDEPDGEPRIVVTSLVGAKGLQAGHVFVVGMNDDHFPRNNRAPTDSEVCELIVALTRATKRCHLVSCGRFGTQLLRPSRFLAWLSDHAERIEVNAAYFGG